MGITPDTLYQHQTCPRPGNNSPVIRWSGQPCDHPSQLNCKGSLDSRYKNCCHEAKKKKYGSGCFQYDAGSGNCEFMACKYGTSTASPLPEQANLFAGNVPHDCNEKSSANYTLPDIRITHRSSCSSSIVKSVWSTSKHVNYCCEKVRLSTQE